jgi:hypothetical protein
MCVSMLDLAMGMSTNLLDDNNGTSNDPYNDENRNSKNKKNNLFDILRVRTDDSKPLVRAKAIQALGTALALDWPKIKSKMRYNLFTNISNLKLSGGTNENEDDNRYKIHLLRSN